MQTRTGVWKAQVALLAVAAAAAIVAGAIAVGVAAAKMAGDFQAGITRLFTTANELKSNLSMVGAGVLSMAGQVGTGAQQLLQAMYWVESGGYHGAAGLNVLRIAAMGAKAENANVTDVAKVLTFALNAYAGTSLGAAGAMNTLIAATSRGEMTLQDLSTAVSNVLPASAKFKISLIDVTAAMATMTAEGDKPASAATHLRQVLLALEAPSKIGVAALKSVGLTSQQVADEMKISLPGALKMITTAVGKTFPEGSAAYNQAIKNISGGSRQMMGFLELTGSHLKTFQDNVNGVTSAVKTGGSSIAGWSAVQSNFNFKMDQAKAAAGAFMIVLGTALLPTLGKLLSGISPIITGFVAWETKTHGIETALNAVVGAITGVVSVGTSIVNFFKNSQLACDILVGAIAALAATIIAMNIGAIVGFIASIPLIVAGFGAWAVAAGAAAVATIIAAAPFIAIGLIVGAVVVGIILAVQHWGAISKWLQGAWAATVAWFDTALHNVGQFFVNIWHGIQTVTSAVWGAILNYLKNTLAGLILIFTAPFLAIGALFVWLYNHNTYFKQLIDTIVNVVGAGLAWLHTAWVNTLNFIVGVWNTLKTGAQVIWSFISTLIFGKATEAKGHITSVFTSVVSFLAGIWANIRSGVTTAWNFVVSIFQGIWGRVSGPLGSLLGNIGKFFAGLATSAWQWGVNLVQKFIDGLLSMIGNLLSAAANLAGQVAKALGFHSPTEYGPGRFADQWAPNFVRMYAQGLLNGIPVVRAAASALAGALPSGMAVPVVSGTGSMGASSSGGSSRVVDLLERLVKAAEAGQVIAIDGDTLAAKLGPHLAAQKILRQGRMPPTGLR